MGDSLHGEELSVGTLLGTGLSLVNRKFWGAVGHQKYDFVMADSSKNLRDITALIDGGKIKAVLDAESPFKFSEIMKMFDKSMSHKARGKLVLHIADDEDEDSKVEVEHEHEPYGDEYQAYSRGGGHAEEEEQYMADEYNAQRQVQVQFDKDDEKQALEPVEETAIGGVVVEEEEEEEEAVEVEPAQEADGMDELEPVTEQVTGDDIADAQDMADENVADVEQ